MTEQIHPHVRQCYVANPTPAFTRPAHHKHKLPAFNKSLLEKLSTRDVSRWAGFYFYDAYHHKTNKPIKRSRHFNKHRARAMNAMTQGISYHLNIISGHVPVSFTTMAVETGLATTSRAGNLSITRATRAMQDLAAYGVITYKLLWDKVTRQYFPADIQVTDRFFDMVGSSAQAWEKASNQQLAWQNMGLAKKGQKPLTKSEASRLHREKLIEITWQQRKAAQDIRRKQKIARIADRKDDTDLRHQISCQLQHELSQGKHDGITMDEFKKLVNQRLALIRKTARQQE